MAKGHSMVLVVCLNTAQKASARELQHHKSHIMRKPAFCICENRGADQPHCDCKLIRGFVLVQFLYFQNLKF